MRCRPRIALNAWGQYGFAVSQSRLVQSANLTLHTAYVRSVLGITVGPKEAQRDGDRELGGGILKRASAGKRSGRKRDLSASRPAAEGPEGRDRGRGRGGAAKETLDMLWIGLAPASRVGRCVRLCAHLGRGWWRVSEGGAGARALWMMIMNETDNQRRAGRASRRCRHRLLGWGEDGARLSDPERGGARNGWERERRRRG